jgi:hypothetical protein
MCWAIWQLSARRTLAWHLPVFLAVCGYALFVTQPLGVDLPATILGGLQGWVLAYRLFVDPPRVAPFIFSQPFSRTRLFFTRWTIGLLLQALTLVVVFAIIALGLRQLIQVYCFGSNWYPMVRWYELSVLWPVGMASLFVYQATAFVLLRRRLRGNRRLSKSRQTANAAFAALATVVALLLTFAYTAARFAGAPPIYSEFFPPVLTWQALAYVVVLVAMTTWASLYCCRNFEVNA